MALISRLGFGKLYALPCIRVNFYMYHNVFLCLLKRYATVQTFSTLRKNVFQLPCISGNGIKRNRWPQLLSSLDLGRQQKEVSELLPHCLCHRADTRMWYFCAQSNWACGVCQHGQCSVSIPIRNYRAAPRRPLPSRTLAWIVGGGGGGACPFPRATKACLSAVWIAHFPAHSQQTLGQAGSFSFEPVAPHLHRVGVCWRSSANKRAFMECLTHGWLFIRSSLHTKTDDAIMASSYLPG